MAEKTGMAAVSEKYNVQLYTIEQLRTLVKASFQYNPHVVPLMIAEAGIGKTVIIKSIAKELGVPYLIVKLANLEKEDMIGYISLSTDGKTYRFVPHKDFPKYLKNPGTIVFFDEINRGQLPTIKAFFNVIDERKFGDFVLPPETKMVAAMNPPDKNYQVADILSEAALRKRFRVFCGKVDTMAYLKYIKDGKEEKGHAYVIDYLTAKPQNVYDYDALTKGQVFPSPHSWSRETETLNNFDKDNPGWENDDCGGWILRGLLSGDMNQDHADTFLRYVADNSTAVNPEDIVYRYSKYRRKVNKLVDHPQGQRTDLLVEMVESVVIFLLQERPDVKKITSNFCNFLADLPEDLSYNLISKLTEESSDNKELEAYRTELNIEMRSGKDGEMHDGYVLFMKKQVDVTQNFVSSD